MLALRASARPTIVGEFLAGLFALGREEVSSARELVLALATIVSALSFEELLLALPSLRLAFSYFPPRERDAFARAVLALHGKGSAPASTLRRLSATPAVIARGVELERRVEATMERFGLARSAR